MGEPSETPARFGRYRVRRPLGRGGVGAVFEVVDPASGLRYALKTLTLASAELAFRREFHTMARLAHPRIVSVHEFGVEAGRPYYTMELLEGDDLKNVAPIEWRAACALMRDIASALALIHTHGLVHRDIAPRNVRSMPDGRAKIIDFGLVATAGGVPESLGGTPPYVGPEALRGIPIDHRLDLFSLGALGYWLLTGENAYPSRGFPDLIDAWRRPTHELSARLSGAPPKLAEVVLALLSLDPLARPSSAAEVIERLTAVGDLAPLPKTEAQRGYLASAALVGRQREMRSIRHHIERARSGHGHAFVIAAVAGTGKSRLLRELSFEAQLAGATVVRAEAGRERGPYGVAGALARALLEALPEHATEAAAPHRSVLARVVPELGSRAPLRPGTSPAEERVLLLASLRAWFLATAARTPLVLAVEDVQRADEASVALLASVARAATSSPLLVAATRRTDEAAIAPSRVAALESAGATLHLAGLEPSEVEDLVRALFGDVANAARLATWMQRVGGSSPLFCTALARHVVDADIVRWVDGVWRIPSEIECDVPSELAAAMDARLGALSGPARRFAQVLALVPGELSLELAVELGEADAAAVFDLLAELARREILLGASDHFRFRHDALREAAIRSIGGEGAALRLRVARALEKRGEASDGALGLLYLHAGEPGLAAPLLLAAARRAHETLGFHGGTPMLEAALEAHERTRQDERVRLELGTMLVLSGSFSDRTTALRYAGETLEALRRHAGVDVAMRLHGTVGRVAALALGQLDAWRRWLVAPEARRGPRPSEALSNFFILSGIVVGIHATSNHRERVRALIESLEAVAVLPQKIPYALYLFSHALLALMDGRLPEVYGLTDRILEILARDRTTPVSDAQRTVARAAALYLRAVAGLKQLDPKLDDELEGLEAMGVPYFDLAAINLRTLKHLYRGETERATSLERRAEPLALEVGATWQLDAFVRLSAGHAHALSRDVVGLRRCLEDLERMAAEGYGVEPYVYMVRGEYLRERGQLDDAAACFEAARGERVIEDAVASGLAETLIEMGERSRARSVAEEALALGLRPDCGSVFARVRARRAIATLSALDGDFAGARAVADEMLADADASAVPLVRGLAHEARARIAMMSGDRAAFEVHRHACGRIFRATENPLLVGRAEQLNELIVDPTPAPGAPPRGEGASAESEGSRRSQWITRTLIETGAELVSGGAGLLSASGGPVERVALALAIAVEATRAARGYLFLLRDGELVLAAPEHGEPPQTVTAVLERVVVGGERADRAGGWRSIALTSSRGQTIGGLALLDPRRSDPEEESLMTRLADELTAAGREGAPSS